MQLVLDKINTPNLARSVSVGPYNLPHKFARNSIGKTATRRILVVPVLALLAPLFTIPLSSTGPIIHGLDYDDSDRCQDLEVCEENCDNNGQFGFLPGVPSLSGTVQSNSDANCSIPHPERLTRAQRHEQQVVGLVRVVQRLKARLQRFQ